MLRISTFLRLGAFLLISTGFLACDSGSTNSGSKESTNNPPYANPSLLEGETSGWSGTYRMAAGSILLDYGSDTLEMRAYCDDADPFKRVVDSNRVPRVDTFAVRMQNDSLALLKPQLGSVNEADLYGRLFVRVSGAAKQLEGVWKLASYITIPEGGDPVAETGWGAYDSLQGIEWTLTINAGTFRLIQKATLDWSTHFVRGWEEGVLRLPGKGDEITAVRVSETVARLTGTITGEVVTVRRLSRHPFTLYGGQWEYSSSDKTHATFVQEDLPKTCPDLPYWFREFQTANSSLDAARSLFAGTDSDPRVGTSNRGGPTGRSGAP